MLTADANDVAGLLNGRMGGDLTDLVLVRAPVRFDVADDVDLVIGPTGEGDIARAGGNGKLQRRPVYGESALESGLALRDGCLHAGQDEKRQEGGKPRVRGGVAAKMQ